MAAPIKNPNFWQILTALAEGMPVKQITHRYNVSTASLVKYKDECLETIVRIKDNVVDGNQLKFPFMNMPLKRKTDFQPSHDGTFLRKWRSH